MDGVGLGVICRVRVGSADKPHEPLPRTHWYARSSAHRGEDYRSLQSAPSCLRLNTSTLGQTAFSRAVPDGSSHYSAGFRCRELLASARAVFSTRRVTSSRRVRVFRVVASESRRRVFHVARRVVASRKTKNVARGQPRSARDAALSRCSTSIGLPHASASCLASSAFVQTVRRARSLRREEEPTGVRLLWVGTRLRRLRR